MRASQFYFPTLKEVPADAEVISQQLMLRAGMIRRLAAGIYTWLPLGLRVLRKVEAIIREEMNRVGAQEILMPMVQPAELWQESTRWQAYGPELLKLQDRHQHNFCLGPTHEEVMTALMRQARKSYKQLPIIFYQIQTKFRDEIRPRFGVMRGREFIMKDAYSFHKDVHSLADTYQTMYLAYQQIFERLGLKTRAVEADTGSIGGRSSHEFQVLADTGEDSIAACDQSNYAANLELACRQIISERPNPTCQLNKIHAPNRHSIQAQCQFLQISPAKMAKLLVVTGSKQPVVGLILRGDHTLNPLKAEKLSEVAKPLCFVEPQTLETLGFSPGFIGPVGLQIPLIVDYDAANLADFVCGANQVDYHLQGVNWERDLPLPKLADLRYVVAGDKSPSGQGHLYLTRGIEVGHIFQLGNKYSTAMRATFAAESGHNQVLEMGCYGIGVSRIVAAAIEQYHDTQGIQWPIAMAPFQIALVPIAYHRSPVVREAAEIWYKTLTAAGFEILLDDREIRPGVAFNEMALMGIPYRLVMSEQGLARDQIEYKARNEPDCQWVAQTELLQFLKQKIHF
jgi:prolyl-tRNA synthetase